MYGAIIGDICGSRYEGISNHHLYGEWELFPSGCRVTDDTIMTVAIAEAIMNTAEDEDELKKSFVSEMVKWARKYPRAGYGGRFKKWFREEEHEPYHSFGNGSAMRVSPCALVATSLDEALQFAKLSAEVTHDHPEGIKGAQAIAACIYMAKTGSSKEDIKVYVQEHFYPLEKSIWLYEKEGARGCTCMVTVPIAIQAFLESTDFEDAIRKAISVGGDTDTDAAMAGSIAWSYYKHANGGTITMEMDCMMEMAKELIPEELQAVIDRFEENKETLADAEVRSTVSLTRS